MTEFTKNMAEDITKDMINVGFKLNDVFYDKRAFGNFGMSLSLDKINISMVRDRVYFECRITKEQFLIMEDGHTDYYHFFPENNFIEDLFNAMEITVPKITVMNNDDITVMENDKNILLLMKLYSETIAKNINLIKHALEKENIREIKYKMEMAAKDRNRKWNEEMLKMNEKIKAAQLYKDEHVNKNAESKHDRRERAKREMYRKQK